MVSGSFGFYFGFNLQQERKIVEYSKYSTTQAISETKDELFNPS